MLLLFFLFVPALTPLFGRYIAKDKFNVLSAPRVAWFTALTACCLYTHGDPDGIRTHIIQIESLES